MRTKQHILLSPLLSLVLLSACTLAPDYHRPDVSGMEQWRDGAIVHDDAIGLSAGKWWTSFESAELDAYVVRALEYNNNIVAALHRITQARAQMRIAGASLLPSAGASGSISRNWDEAFRNASDGTTGFRAGVDVSYAVDLWGRNAANAQSARLRAAATVFDRDALRLTLVSDVTLAYAQVLALNDQLRMTRERHANAKDILRIVEVRFREGSVSGLELAQQRTELANFDASLASLEEQRNVALNALAVLVGQPPQSITMPEAPLASLTLPSVGRLAPADLLTRRPDLRSAEMDLIAAHADIGVARAAFFPSLNIGGSLSIAATPIDAATNTAAGLAGSLTAPIFQGGALQGQLDSTKAVRDQLIASYRQAILVAFQEAENAFAGLRSADIRLKAYETSVQQSEIAYRISRDRFDAGSIDFLTLLDAQRSYLQAQESLIAARFDRIEAAAMVFKAMGGGWNEAAALDEAEASL